MEGHCVTATWEALHKVCGAKPTDIETALVGAFFEAMGKATPTTKLKNKTARPPHLGLPPPSPRRNSARGAARPDPRTGRTQGPAFSER